MAQWQNTRLVIEWLLVQVSPEKLCCVLEQDTLSSALIAQVQRKILPDMTEKLLIVDRDIKH